MSAPTLIEALPVVGHVVRVEPEGCAPVVLLVQSLSGLSAEARRALSLPAGPAVAVTWVSRGALGHEERGAAVLRRQPENPADLGMSLFIDGNLSVRAAHASGEALFHLLTWEDL